MKKFREWFYYPIMMPTNAEEQGPCDLKDAVRVDFEVWDREFISHGSFEFLADAVDKAIELNEALEKLSH